MKLRPDQLLFSFERTALGRYKVRVTSHDRVTDSALEYDLFTAGSAPHPTLSNVLKDSRLGPILDSLPGLRSQTPEDRKAPVLLFEVPPEHDLKDAELVLRWDLAQWKRQRLWRYAAVAWLPSRRSVATLPESEPRYDGSDKLRSMLIDVEDGGEGVVAQVLPEQRTRRQSIQASGISSSQRAALEWLLKDLFTESGLEQLARKYKLLNRFPRGTASLDQQAAFLASALNCKGSVGPDLFGHLEQKCPLRKDDIRAVQAVSALECLLSPQVPDTELPHFVYLDFHSTSDASACRLLLPGSIQVGAEPLAQAFRSRVDVVAFSDGNLPPSFAFTLLEEAPRCVVAGVAAGSRYLLAYQRHLARWDWLQAHWAACREVAGKRFVPPMAYLKLPTVWCSLEPLKRLRDRLELHLAELGRAGALPPPLVYARIELLKALLKTHLTPAAPPAPARRRAKRAAPPR